CALPIFELTRLAATPPQAINLRLAAAEHRGGIVFLHEVRDGPASRSYGIQVARLAGMPAAVIRAADKVLGELEARARAEDEQLDLFAMPAEGDAAVEHHDGEPGQRDPARPADTPGALHAPEAEVLERLRALDPDALSAREALALLYSLRERLGAGDGLE